MTAATTSVESEEEPARPWYLSRGVRMIPGLRHLYYWLTDFRTEYVPEANDLPGRALDVGCASGDRLMRLTEAGWIAEGVELMEEPVGAARSRGFEVTQGMLQDAAFPGNRFDAVFMSMVLEHVPDPLATLREVHRVLRPDGWFVFSIPNYACWERFVFRRFWFGLDLPRHLQHFTPGSIRDVLTSVRFDRIQVLHQRDLSNIIASTGLWLRRFRLGRKLGQRMVDFTERPSLWWQLALALPARVPAFFHQGGRLTVVARAAAEDTDEA